jgi:hypothetical protein
MLSQRCIDDSAIEEYLGRIRNMTKDPYGFLVLLIVVVFQSQHPCLNFLLSVRFALRDRGSLIPVSMTSFRRIKLYVCAPK